MYMYILIFTCKKLTIVFLQQIPVSGYGGVGKLVVEGASIADMNRYCLDMGDISLGQETGEKVIVRNVGSRPVFVKLMAYAGE